MKVHNILVALVLSMVASFAFAQTADQCDPEAVKVEVDDGGFMCVFGLKPLSPEAAAKKSAREAEELAEKKAAAQAYLQKDVIKMTVIGKNYGGIPVAFPVEAYPKEKTIRVYKVGHACDQGIPHADFSVEATGDLLITRNERIPGCGYLHILINPERKKIKVYLSVTGSFGDSTTININNNWTLDN